ncbi:Lysophospholipase L1 [Desulfuromusa kysingii]|uniref:Lysophospholipase L1 n=1 Tax=Desulfuromusa kysingii TaxID=37625 RepID=A0A1H3VIF7_9BACT|nr:GDSL-type esterase/lipase family protein [Desulfuromusa kysingii]SDZ74549.1 Lysophospholipase L1 [Desulfuromusa kysingii]
MKSLTTLIFSLCMCFLLVACDKGAGTLSFLRPNDVVLAFGDSLTTGVGTRSESSYPAQLNRFIARKVVNAGVSGEVSAEGVTRLPGVLDQFEPELLIICHGGNDILRKLDRQQLKTNLRYMYEAANQRDIEVVMIAVPQLGFGLEDVPLYQELADELKIPLLSGTLKNLLADNHYKSDPIHLNEQGYKKLAEAVADLLDENGALH